VRGSPDGIVSCTCHSENWIIEIKCPYSARSMDPVEAVNKGLLKYIRTEGEQFNLIRGDSSGYFEQVQGCMALVEVRHCDFVVWTQRGVLVVPVAFDDDYWNNILLPNLKKIFESHVVPEILTERIKNGLKLFEDEVDIRDQYAQELDTNAFDFATNDCSDIELDDVQSAYDEPCTESTTSFDTSANGSKQASQLEPACYEDTMSSHTVYMEYNSDFDCAWEESVE
jgi:hypothetical protein